MLSREYRLTRNKDIERVARHGSSFFTKILGIKYLPRAAEALVTRGASLPPRFAVVVGLVVHKKSTKRNRPKRQIREILKKHLAAIRPGYDIMVIARKEILGKKFQEIDEALMYALEKTGLIKKLSRY